MQDGITQGKRGDLVGGGLKRSQSALGGVESYDERILGSGDFVEHLRQEKELAERMSVNTPLRDLLDKVAAQFGIKPEALAQRNRSGPVADARALFCYLAVREIGHSGADVARMLNLSRAGVSIAAGRGELIFGRDEKHSALKLTT